MKTYFDTSVVTKWYLPEADSVEALRVRARYSPPAVLTPLHRLELATAWQLKVFRRELAKSVVERAWSHVADDVAAGIWHVPDFDLGEAFSHAELLSRRHVSALGTRSLDVLHVATALVLGASSFVTADIRQTKLAKLAGMRVTCLG